jgi:uncharacterized protein YndB with AHSA1/START domain
MPVKKDETGKRWVEMEVLLPGTPEQVWRAMATGPGYAAWFVRADIEERVGGKVEFALAPGDATSGLVTFWEPPRRFGYVEIGWMEDAPPVATEITITGRAGGRCVMRMVHSLFASTDDWDDQLESFESGWPTHFSVLRLYLAHHAGEAGAAFQVRATVEGDALTLWKRMTGKLALSGADLGERRTTPARPEALTGVVEAVRQEGRTRTITLRLEAPARGAALVGVYDAGDKIHVGASLFAWGDDALGGLAARERAWAEWLAEALAE